MNKIINGVATEYEMPENKYLKCETLDIHKISDKSTKQVIKLLEILGEKDKELERYKNIIDEIEAIVYADIPNIDVRISIQEVLDKLKELKGE